MVPPAYLFTSRMLTHGIEEGGVRAHREMDCTFASARQRW